MLSELNIQNFAVIKDMQLKLGHGMTIISGDEGVGKSLIVDAISILLGARASADFIRSGSSTARVEGVFWPSADILEQLVDVLRESAIEPEGDGMLTISREIQQQGRSVARLNSRVVPLSLLRQVGQKLVDVHGQTDNISLLDNRHQLELLDAHDNLTALKNTLSDNIDKLRKYDCELSSANDGKSDGRQELLRYQAEEIERADLKEGEDISLQNKRDVLLRAEAIKDNCLKAYGNLYGEERSVTVLIHEALISVRGLNGSDSSMPSYIEHLENTIFSIEEIARDIRNYGESVDADVGQLDEIEQRLHLLSSLKRKYGSTIEDILSFHAKATSQLEAMESHHERINQLKKERDFIEKECGKLAEELSLSRRRAANSLTKLINEELADLGLQWAKFDICLRREEDKAGLPTAGGKRFSYTREGIDRVDFMISTNPGEPMRSLHTIASGGETCRIMLAAKSALKRVDPIPTLIFDEIDGSVGGRSGDTVGRKLATVAKQHQVICITHLPQIACFGDSHIRLIKDTSSGRSSTRIQVVEGESRIHELAEMLGSEQAGQPMLDGAEELLIRATSWKEHNPETVSVP